MERIGKLSESDRSFDIEFWQRQDQLLSLQRLGIWWWNPIDLRKKVTPNSNFKELLSGLNTAGAKYLQK